ncbi:hypothetical protein INR77_10390 [Erythrobacter sp. SCSIO 43205]|uniref:hypothetical protein n=1 Tax=Erythrobacter sp. SCSIO 43205 TaxID=2779361 RepID=UPI001CA7F73D|nr:hypothetical protein [Erythrobacter sp. SCSIO 43205]UAB77227.1 hypothetical protein INR77_10390 [Erythrobacter sp. SCSIO 43205]
MDRSQSANADGFLREELARGTRARASVAPVIAHLLDSDGPSLFSDAILAGLRGKLDHIARQLLEQMIDGGIGQLRQREMHKSVSNRLAGDAAIIDHLFATTLEGAIAKNLSERCAIDPVLSPLLQELIASDNPSIAELAINVLAAQSRFSLSHARMELPLKELPFDVFLGVLEHGEQAASDTSIALDSRAIAGLKRSFDEATNRVGLLTRLVSTMRGGAIAGLDLSHAGLALFASSCAALLPVDREQAVFACHESQTVRLAVMLRAAGLSAETSARQTALLGGSKQHPVSIETMSQSHAQDLLAAHPLEAARQ